MPFARLLYTSAGIAALPFLLPVLAAKGRLDRQSFGFAPAPLAGGGLEDCADDAPTVWLHAVSVGEAAAADQLIVFFRQRNCRLFLTHTTAAGGDWLRTRHGEYAQVCRLPLDLPFAASRFLNRVRPQLAVFVEAEYWPNLWAAARARNIPVLLANARFSAKTARRHSRFPQLMREMAQAVSVAAAQTRADARRLRLFGVENVRVAGNLKFDRAANQQQMQTGRQWKQQWQTDKAIALFAGSRSGEEEILLDEINGEFLSRCFAILAPRHPERGDEVASMLQKRGIRFNRRSENADPDPHNTQLHLADTLGEMDTFYACCDVAAVCGSFLPFGGQNPIEAMAAGAAAVIGPHADNYRALVSDAQKRGALQQAAGAQDAIRRLQTLAEDAPLRERQTGAARELCKQSRGALQTHQTVAEQLLTLN